MFQQLYIQNISQTEFIIGQKMLTSSNFCILVNFRTLQDNTVQLKDMQLIYFLKEHFTGYHICFTKHKKLFLFWINRSFSNTLFFADFCLFQKKLEVLWQQTIYQQTTPFDRFYQLTMFHDQDVSQTRAIEDSKNVEIIKISLVQSIFRSGRTTLPSQKACNLCLF